MLSREPPGSITMVGTNMAMNDCNSKLLADMKIKVMDYLQQLLHKAGETSIKACRVYNEKYDSHSEIPVEKRGVPQRTS